MRTTSSGVRAPGQLPALHRTLKVTVPFPVDIDLPEVRAPSA